MCAGVVRELDHEQLPALHAAANAVGSGYFRTAFLSCLQDAVHLSVGLVVELDGVSRIISENALHALDGLHVLRWKEEHNNTRQLL